MREKSVGRLEMAGSRLLGRRVFACLAFAWVSIPASGFANESVSATNANSNSVSASVLATIDAIVQHHLDPPTRQSLVLEFCREVTPATRTPLGLGRAISQADRQQIHAIVAEQLALIDEDHRSEQARNALVAVAQRLASSKLLKGKDQRVNEQLAANRYVGIGIAIGVKDEFPAMMQIFEDGPADLGGAKKGDRIIKVDGEETFKRPLREVIDLLRGPAGTKVEVVVSQEKRPERTLLMTRDVVPFKHVEGFKVVEPGIAAVTINSITASIVRDLRRLTPQMMENEIDGIVLQVGSGDTPYRPALLFANALVDGGVLGSVESESGDEPILADAGQLWPEVKIVVTVQSQPRDALAWSLETLRKNRGIFVEDELARYGSQSQQNHWKYGTVPLEDSDDVLVLPVGRLVSAGSMGIDPGSIGSQLKMRPVGQLFDDQVEAAILHSRAALGRLGRNTPLDRAVLVLKKQISSDKRKRTKQDDGENQQ